jgi:hypothetical protein
MTSQLRTGTDQDTASIRLLLESAGLPTDDLLTSNPQFVLERHSVPPDVQGSAEFRLLCPASATCMAKTLASPS